MNCVSYCIAVARHNEDVKWLLDFVPNVYISNKGNKQNIPEDLIGYTVDVPNIGLDQYCHLDYIVRNYNNLPEVVLFTQAGIQDHPDIHEPIHRTDRTKICDSFDPYVKTISTSQMVHEMIEQACLYGSSLNASQYLFPGYTYCATPEFKVYAPDELTTELTFGQWFRKYINDDLPRENRFLWFKNAIFAVQRKYILTRPKSFYEGLRAQITQRRQDVLHYIERAWYYILNLDTNLEVGSAISAISSNLSIFKTLDKIVQESGQGWVEGSLFFFGNRDMSYNPEFVHKQVNLYNLAKNAKNILEIGFNAGHSTALMMMANPNARILHFDLKEHAYVDRCYKFLEAVFGRDRFIGFVAGDTMETLPRFVSDVKFDLIHFDGGHFEKCVINDITECKRLCDPNGHVVVIDDYNMEDVKKVTDQWVGEGKLKALDGEARGAKMATVLAKYYGKSYHFVGRYT